MNLYSVVETCISKINSTKRRQFIVGFIPVFRSQTWLTRKLPEPPFTESYIGNTKNGYTVPSSLQNLVSTWTWTQGKNVHVISVMFYVFSARPTKQLCHRKGMNFHDLPWIWIYIELKFVTINGRNGVMYVSCFSIYAVYQLFRANSFLQAQS